MDIEMFGKLSDAFGPSGFEEDVIRTIADYCKEFDVENDAMNNLYVRMPGTEKDSRPVIQLDAHLDACGFMVQNIQDNGCLGIIMLGGFHLTSLPAHAVWIRTISGKMVHGIICAKPVHFMTTAERSSQTLEIEKMYVDAAGLPGRRPLHPQAPEQQAVVRNRAGLVRPLGEVDPAGFIPRPQLNQLP